MSNTETVTCVCGTEVDAETRAVVGTPSSRAASCSHNQKAAIRPTESKMHRGVETK